MKQLTLDKVIRKPRRGKAKGGRPPKNGVKSGVSHLKRAALNGQRHPVHVTLRMLPHVWNLRSRRCFGAIARSFYAANGKFGLRLVRFNVLGNHLHLVCEASDEKSLSKGMQGLEVRIAKALNHVMERHGSVFDDRYHGHVLRSPTEVAHALAYVRDNATKHFGRVTVDYSSASYPALVIAPRTWLLRLGIDYRLMPPKKRMR